MLSERPKIEQAIRAVFSREGFEVKRVPTSHAGGKWILSNNNYMYQPGNIELDLNYMFREPLWEPKLMNSIAIGPHQVLHIPVLDKHELAAGKLAALFSRTQARDLYDSVNIFEKINLDHTLLRMAFVVYGGMNRIDWRTISLDSLSIETIEFERKLYPLLRSQSQKSKPPNRNYGNELIKQCRQGLSNILPFTEYERHFLDKLLDKGVIDATLLTDDEQLQNRIYKHPLLVWKSQHVKKHYNLS